MSAPRPERADAAANRRRILTAAQRLLTEQDHSTVTMDAVAAAAGVGKGTIFRRFGDRAGLAHALIDESMREFQDAFLSGPPPLGPGAPAAARLQAFVLELLRCYERNPPFTLALAAAPDNRSQVMGALSLHVGELIHDIAPELDADLTAHLLLGAFSPPIINRARGHGAEPATLQAAALGLLHGLTP